MSYVNKFFFLEILHMVYIYVLYPGFTFNVKRGKGWDRDDNDNSLLKMITLAFFLVAHTLSGIIMC